MTKTQVPAGGKTADQIVKPGIYEWLDPRGEKLVGYVSLSYGKDAFRGTFSSTKGFSRDIYLPFNGPTDPNAEGTFYGPLESVIPS